ncbi:MAG: polysaccharide deacetylase family protein [Labilithrix sp.]|nr:polysaccharide deacetylase family protein [Labilithrix sp.]MCW5813945.1 polysaccharide deacetylase family protein [Labilithrix sp.]
MLTRRLARSFLALSSLLAAACASGCAGDEGTSNENEETQAPEAVAGRPPQFVLLAFDGSLNIPFWKESRQYAKDTGAKLTYFMSGVYFIADNQKTIYNAPHGLGRGKSAIGFGGASGNIKPRYEQVQAAINEGHEMGSHANGHFDGSSWSQADWDSEFSQFNSIMFSRSDTPRLSIGGKDVVGFRAPQLGHSAGLWPVLAKYGYKYDTSRTAPANYWPQIKNGVWNFPLAELRIVGSGKKTLSMDYNFYVADSRGNPDAANKATYRKQMVDTYMAYFEGNYFGNRAPVHIGHHFSKWNGGAYWEAMQQFTKRVCRLPEVKCVTNKELLTFVEANKDKIAGYQAGNFTKMPRPPEAGDPVDVSAPFTDEERAEMLAQHEHHDEEDAASESETELETETEE